VRATICGVFKLIGPERAGHLFGDSARHVIVVFRIGEGHGRNHAHVGAAHAKQIDLLLRLIVRNADDAVVSAFVCNKRERDAGVAGRAFDDRPAGFERAARFGIVNHRARRAILDRSARVEEFRFAQDAPAQLTREGAQLDQGRRADRVREAHGVIRS